MRIIQHSDWAAVYRSYISQLGHGINRNGGIYEKNQNSLLQRRNSWGLVQHQDRSNTL